MRKNGWLTIVVGALLVGGAADAQAQGLEIGAKLGASFSTWDLDPEEDLETLTALTGGGFVRIGFGGFSIQPELMFVRKGTEFATGTDDDFEVRVDYVEIPLLLRYDIGLVGAPLSPYLYAGPAVAFEVACEFAGSSGGVDATIDCDDAAAELGEDFEHEEMDFGVMVGGGVGFGLGPGRLLVEGRYTWGLRDLLEPDPTEGPAELKNRSGAVLVGYSVGLGR